MNRVRSTGDIVRGLLTSLEFGGSIRQHMAAAHWPDVVGQDVARRCFVEAVRDGVLIVRTPGSVWSQELSLAKHTIIARLNALMGVQTIHDIRFRVGAAPREPEEPPEPAVPPLDELARVELTEEDRRDLAAVMQRVSAIGDPEFRARTAAIVDNAFRLRRWRLERGWRPCPVCGDLYRQEADLCALCQEGRRARRPRAG